MSPNGILAKFIFPLGCSENFTHAQLPAPPRVGDFVRSHVPQSGVYVVKSVTFLIHDFVSPSQTPSATAEVVLEVTEKIES